jgi:hypothetical protein
MLKEAILMLVETVAKPMMIEIIKHPPIASRFREVVLMGFELFMAVFMGALLLVVLL